ncbi:MAG: hypothetical protein MJ125_06595 [Clostridia bacterium]|nr:hypothetical protein [Clostridia bacterium]
MKKILAVLLVLAMVCVVFAACGKDEPETTTTEADTSVSEEVTDTTEEATKEDASEPEVTDENGETEESTEAADDEDPSTWDTAKIVAYYNEAREITAEKGAPAGFQKMALAGEISGDGAIGVILKVLQPAAEKALSKNSKATDYIPAHDSQPLLESDVTSATAKKDANGNIVLDINLKNQVDGPDGDSKNGGAVARGVSTLGSIENALKELGAELTEGRNTVTLTYNNAYIKNCVINPETKMIKKATYHFVVNVLVKDAKAKLGISVNLQNLRAPIEYTVQVG